MQKIVLWTVLPLYLASVVAFMIKFDSILAPLAEFLIVGEEPRQADAIIVLSGGLDRVSYGAQLYHAGYADKLILSGGGRGMKPHALSLGVPDSAIIREEQSGTTFENAMFSLRVVQEHGYRSVLVVTSPYHTRRSGIIFNSFFQGIDVTFCPVPYDPDMTRTWWKRADSAKFVITEYLKLIYHFLIERN